MTVLSDDFAQLVQDAQSSNGYLAWARDNHGGKGYAIDNPKTGSELQKWMVFRDQLLRGTRPLPPAMTTALGKWLVDGGVLYLDATAPVVTPPPPPPPPQSGYPKQGVCAPLGAIRSKDLNAYMTAVVALGNGHPMALRTDWWPGSTDFDKVRAAAEAHGITVLPILNYDPGNRPTVAAYAAQAAQLANLGVTHINLLNEPNLGGWTPQDAAAYTRAAYDAVKAAKPACVVVAPDVAANAGAGKTPQSCVDWLTVYRASGGKQDVVALNLYNDAEQLDTNWNLWSKVDAIKALFPGQPVWSLEGGCKVLNGAGGSELSYGTKWGSLTGSQYQEKCISTALDAAARGVIDVFHAYSLYDDASPGGFGLYASPGATARPAVAAFKQRAR